MPEYNSNLRALNDIVADYGLSAGRRFEIDAWNALAVHFGGSGGHQFNIDAMNEIVGLIGGQGTFEFEIDAVNEISRVFGGASNFQFVEDALSEISDLPVFSLDTTPSAFSFTDVTDADLNTVYESDAIIVSGLTAPSPMTIVGGEYQINGGTGASAPTTVVNDDSVKVRATSSADPETAVNVVLTIGGVSDTFTITTAAEGGGVPAWLEDLRAPSNDLPTVALKFIDENYWDGSAEVALSALITLADTDTTLTVNGLNIPQTAGSDPAFAVGELFDLLVSQNWTIAASFLVPAAASTPSERIVRVYSDPSGTDALSVEVGFEGKLNTYEYDATNYREALGVATLTRDVVQKLFVTRTAAKLVGSLNSETLIVSEGGTAAVFTALHAYIGNSPGEGGENYYIRSLVVYPPQPDADMAAILALL